MQPNFSFALWISSTKSLNQNHNSDINSCLDVKYHLELGLARKKMHICVSTLGVFRRGGVICSHPSSNEQILGGLTPQLAWRWGCGLCMCSSNRNATAMRFCLQIFPRLTTTPQISYIPPKECLVFLLFDLVTVGGRRWETNGGKDPMHVNDSLRVSSTLHLTHRIGNVWLC